MAAAPFRFRSPQDLAATQAFFRGHDDGHRLFHRVLALVAQAGPFEVTATKSRVSITPRTRAIWCHEANDDGSIWLGFLLPRRVASARLRSGPAGGRWSHHVKVAGPADLDDELAGWLREAYASDLLDGGAQPRDPRKPRKPVSPGSDSAAGRQSTPWHCPDCGRGFSRRNASHSCAVQDVNDLLAPYPKAKPVFRAVRDAIAAVGPAEVAATKTQVSWRNRTRFAWLWVPAMALKRGAPDVYLSFGLPAPLRSRRMKEVTEVRPGRFMHHVLVPAPAAVDPELEGWLRAAFEAAA